MNSLPFIEIKKGEAHEQGTKISLNQEQILIGRAWDYIKPNIALTSLYISKKHALIKLSAGRFYITDLSSKHGTYVNGFDIGREKPYRLKNGDQISLAKGTVLLVLHNPGELDDGATVDFSASFKVEVPEEVGLSINLERREVLVEGKLLPLSGKDMELLILLYENINKAVSYNDIKVRIWPERLVDGEFPDVGNDEITVLVYRLRKRLGIYGNRIVAVPRYGYMLDI